MSLNYIKLQHTSRKVRPGSAESFPCWQAFRGPDSFSRSVSPPPLLCFSLHPLLTESSPLRFLTFTSDDRSFRLLPFCFSHKQVEHQHFLSPSLFISRCLKRTDRFSLPSVLSSLFLPIWSSLLQLQSGKQFMAQTRSDPICQRTEEPAPGDATDTLKKILSR